MTTVIGMFDHIQNIDSTLPLLFDNYDLGKSDVEIIVKPDRLSHMKSHTDEYKDLIQTYEDNLMSHLTDLGIPKADALYFTQAIKQGKEVIAIEADKENAPAIQAYLNSDRPQEIKSAPRSRSHTATTKTTDALSFDVIEENLKVGKRTVETGGVNVEKVVTQTPVRQDVQLKHEEVVVDRKPVSREATSQEIEHGFKEKSFELHEYAEEAVVQKEARVIEEVQISKQTHRNTETIEDTLRRVDVRISDIDSHENSDLRFDASRPLYLSHYEDNFKSTKRPYESFEPAYRYGHAWAISPSTREYSYAQVEDKMRDDWPKTARENNSDSTWDDIKDAAQYAWNSIRSKFN